MYYVDTIQLKSRFTNSHPSFRLKMNLKMKSCTLTYILADFSRQKAHRI